MTLVVDNPIINSPFEEPIRYWEYKEGQPVLVGGRRLAGLLPLGVADSRASTADTSPSDNEVASSVNEAGDSVQQVLQLRLP